MKIRSQALRSALLSLTIPVGGIAGSYAAFIDRPLCNQIADAKAKLVKAEEAIAKRSAEHAINQRSLAEVLKSLDDANKLVTATPSTPADSNADSSAGLPSDSGTTLARLSATLALFARHQVTCVASQPNDEPSDSCQGSSTGQAISSSLRVTLSGSFAQMHSALAELQATLDGIAVVSVEMEPSVAGDGNHQWKIVLRI